jgi:aryl-alcohol dehydrogenase-like predicted oxidoreductase
MRKRPLGNTSLKTTELGLGTWGLSGDGYGPVKEIEQDRVIDRALTMGIRLFDTADCYADGAMESRLGRMLPRGDGTVIVTKIGTRRDLTPPRKDFSPAYLREAFERSRERLGRDVIDCVLLHNPSAQTFENGGVRELMEELRDKRWIVSWGASVGSPQAGGAALDAGAQVLEVVYNLFNTREVTALSPVLAMQRPGVIARSVLAHGLLCGQWPPGKEFPEGDHRAERWSSDELRRRILQLNAVRPMIGDQTPTLRSIALRFALSNSVLSSVLIGPRNTLQLDQLVREAGRMPPYLDPERLASLQERLLAVGIVEGPQ